MATSDEVLTFLNAQGWSAGEIAYRSGGKLVWQVEACKPPQVILAPANFQHQAWLLAAEQAFAVTRDDCASRWDAANRLLAAHKDSGEALEKLDAIEYDLGMLDFAERGAYGRLKVAAEAAASLESKYAQQGSHLPH